jgi:hypothetical protein
MVRKSEALHLRAVRQEDQGFSFHQKTPNMCEMHKNRQNSVDFINYICLYVGMDARKLKKQILYEALVSYRYTFLHGKSPLGQRNMLSGIMDIDEDKVTEAKKTRFLRVLLDMIINAESKI